jgi:hypothetical protein
MHTEHLQNVRPARVVAGWLVAIAMTSLAALAALGIAMIWTQAAELGTVPSVLAVMVGFWVGGFFAGFRALEAPILHGIAIGLTSLVAWAGLNAIVAIASPGMQWDALTPGRTAAALLAQIVGAVLGALMGYNVALRGKPSLAEHEPLENA